MIPNLTLQDVDDYKKNILRSGINGLEGIAAFQLDQLYDSIEKEIIRHIDRFDDQIMGSPDYPYPEIYKSNRMQYWQDRSYGFQNCIKIQNVIIEFWKLNQTTRNNTKQAETELNQTKEQSESMSNNNVTQDLPKTLILFNKKETIEKLHTELKEYFPEKQVELLYALEGKKLDGPILFPHNQNKFVEVFLRVKYNGLLLSTPKEIQVWICTNFSRRYKKGEVDELKKFNESTVSEILTKHKGEPTRSERICIVDWLPYISPSKRKD